ncbi:MAG: hypothetical protein AB8D78_03065 [Akkermansiaceae bacterium]
MKSTPPFICGLLLTAMAAAGLSHYWSIETFIADYPSAPAIRLAPTIPKDSEREPLAKNILAADVVPSNLENAAQKEFFNSLLAELKTLKNENRDLRDLMGETNRDVMKLAFRVDTHSESFRPLPANEQRDDTSFDQNSSDFPGVLPPRASPVYPLGE